MGLKKVILISNSTYPIPDTGGGSMILYRHLVRLKEEGYEISFVNLLPNSKFNSPIKEINITRRWYFPPLIKNLYWLVKIRCWLLSIIIKKKIELKEGDIIISILGEYINLTSHYLAKAKKLSHFFIFHDDHIFNQYERNNILKVNTYIKLIKNANHTFVVSEEIRGILISKGIDNKKITLLYPIPEGNTGLVSQWPSKFNDNKFSVCYSGAIFREYHQEILKQILSACENEGCDLNIFTKSPVFNDSEFWHSSSLSIKPPFDTLWDLKNYLSCECWISLIFYSFDPGKELRIVSSFPSKFCEYVHTGIPVLIIAPSFSSIGKWAIKHEWLAYCSSDSIEEVSCFLSQLKNFEFWEKCKSQSLEVAKNIFNPDSLHQIFSDKLNYN